MSLNVKLDEYYLSDSENLSNSVETVIRKFENHPSVYAIKQNISVSQDLISNSDILQETKVLNNKKVKLVKW